MKKVLSMILLFTLVLFTGTALADSVDPVSFADTLAVGESVTITKTVTVDDAPPTTGRVDVMFLIDTSGSMGGEIAAAKAAAASILSTLSASYGDVATGVGYYSEPGSMGVRSDLTTDATAGAAAINAIYLGLGGGGGDFPEEGINAVYEAATEASWRPGSTRFIIALGDATFKESDGTTLAMALDALDDSGATFIGIDYGFMDYDFSGINPTALADASGGSIIAASGLSVDDLVDDITSGIDDAYSEYDEVSLSDLGAGLPGIGVSVVATGAGGSGDTYYGDYDRSVARTFEFEVTFTGLAEGDYDFDTHALVDGGIVASEADSFTVGGGDVPEPAFLFLMGSGLLGLAGVRRKMKK